MIKKNSSSIQWLNQDLDKKIFGNKACTLSQMSRASFPVPNGFVIPPYVIIDKADLADALKKLNTEILIVRSSAIAEDSSDHSFAGMFKTVVGLPSNVPDIIEAIMIVRNSISSTRSNAYQDHFLLNKKQRMAVIIQKAIKPSSSGVCFTRLPNKKGIMIIEGVWGLARPLVEGKINPDRWEIKRDDKSVLLFELGKKDFKETLALGGVQRSETTSKENRKPCLNLDDLSRLVELSLKIEQLFGRAQDIEWATENNKIWIVQSRDIPRCM